MQDGSSGQSFWLTAPLTGSDSYLRSAFFGYPDWTPWEDIVGVKSNVSFCLTGYFPNPCENAIWRNGGWNGDERNALNSSRCVDGSIDALTADDVGFEQPVRITDLHWLAVEHSNFAWNGTDDVVILDDDGDGGGPGTVLVEQRDVPNFRADTGDTAFGLPIYLYTIDGLDIALDAGRYWIAMRPVEDPCNAAFSFILIADLTGAEAQIISGYFGINEWTPWSEFIGKKINAAFCITGRYEPCRDRGIWDNGQPDGLTGLNCSRSTDPDWIEIWTVDDIKFDARVRITDLHWWTVDFDGFNWNGTDDVIILDDDGAGGGPGTVIVEQLNIPNTRLDSGVRFLGYTVWLYSIAGVGYGLTPGHYFIGMRPVQDGQGNDSYWMTAAAKGSTAYLRSKFYGFPDWTKWSDLFGADIDVAFCLTGYFDPCEDSIYDNGRPNGANGLNSSRSTDPDGVEIWTVDDIRFSQRVRIRDLHWWSVEFPDFGWNGTDDVIILDDDGDGDSPGTVLVEDFDIKNTRFDTGEDMFGYDVLLYTIDGLAYDLDPGRYFIGMRPVCDATNGVSFNLTADVNGAIAYLRSDYYGFPDWTSWEDLGRPYDYAFCITGVVRTGACCFENGDCVVTTKQKCEDNAGVYLGDDTDCDPNPCRRGACCFENGECVVTTKPKCEDNGGVYQGDGTDCDPNPCVGACCYKDGSCKVLSPLECEESGGSYQGNGTDCDPNPCPQPTGACCRDENCTVTTKQKCDDAGGVYLGDGTDCDPNPCRRGACCLEDGTCKVGRRDQCDDAGGLYLGDGTDCDPNPCLRGACCFGEECIVTTRFLCHAEGGEFQGVGTDCDPNPCKEPTGACCIDSQCVVTTKTECEESGGKYLGDGVACDDRICRCLDQVLGDSNCDGSIDFDDIDCFVAALIGLGN